MIFDPDTGVKILSAMTLSWEDSHALVAPRPFHALSFRVQGDARFDDGKNQIHAGTGDLLYMPAGCRYRLDSGTEKLLCVHFLLKESETNRGMQVFHPRNPAAFEELYQILCQTWQMKKPGYEYRAVSLLYQIMARLTRQVSEGRDRAAYERIAPAIAYLHEHIADSQLTVGQLTAVAGMSDTTFRRLFYQVYAATPNRYINRLRVELAHEKLESGLYSVEQAAVECGFFDAKYFSTVFKRLKGYSPSACKNER